MVQVQRHNPSSEARNRSLAAKSAINRRFLYQPIAAAIIALALLFLLTGCTSNATDGEAYSSTALFIRVVDKAHSEDYKQQWVMAYNSSAPREEGVKIFVDNVMVWKLIESGHEYFASYEGSAVKGFHLTQINYPGDQDTLR